MKFNYYFDDEEFEYEPDWYDIQKEIKKQLEYLSKAELIDYIMDLIPDKELEEEFHDALEEAFRDVASEACADGQSIKELENYYWNNRE